MAGDEPDLPAGSLNTPGGGFRTAKPRRTTVGTLAAKVTAVGFQAVTREATSFYNVLKNIRSEMRGINAEARGGGGTGVGQGPPTGAAGTQASPTGGGGMFAGMAGRIAGSIGGGGWGATGASVIGPGGFNYGPALRIGGAAAVGLSVGAQTLMGPIENRFQRNVAQSAPISSRDVFTASMYGPQLYPGMEMRRYGAGGEYIGSREGAQAAQQIALGFGTTAAGSERFLTQVGAMVQGSGGALTAPQAAAQVSLFAAPQVSQRARALGVAEYRQQGEIQNVMDVGLSYVKEWEKRNNIVMNAIDYANLRAPGSPIRARWKQLYNLSDEAIEVAINAGMQNLQFKGRPGAGGGGRDINFGSAKDLGDIGLKPSVLGLQAARFGTTQQRREARFFENQEGAMVGRLEMEGKIQEALSDTEQAFGDLIGPMHEFQRVLQAATTVLGLLGAGSMMMGGAGGLGRMFGGRGGAGGVPGTGAPGTGVPGAGRLGAAGMLRGAAGIAGPALAIGGLAMASQNTSIGGIATSTLMTGGGAALTLAGYGGMAALTGPAAPFVIGGAAVIGGGLAAVKYFKGVDQRNVKEGYNEGVGLPDAKLIAELGDYRKNAEYNARTAGSALGRRKGEGAGGGQRGKFDAFARRRGALLAAALDEAFNNGELDIDPTNTSESTRLAELVQFFSSDGVFDDDKLWSNRDKAAPYINKIRNSKTWERYFGQTVKDPFSFVAVNTNESQGLITSSKQQYAATLGTSPTGDAVFALTEGSERPTRRVAKAGMNNRPTWGDGIEDKALSRGDSWNFLDSRMKTRLLAMFRASGGRVGLQPGGGWRSTERQRQMFLDRHREDPNGDIEWEGKRWSLIPGNAAAAPPGRSYHEIGLAADLEGDLGWMNAHAGEFQLIHFANVNNEPWHVQPAEIPRGRSEYTGTTDGGEGGAATGTGAAGAAAPMPFGGGGGGSISGVNFSIVAAAGASSGGGGGLLVPAAAAGTGGTGGAGGGGVTVPGGVLSFEDAVRVAHGAGFKGNALQLAVAIAMGESGLNPKAHNPDASTGDDSYGLWQINMLGGLGPDRRAQWGLASNDALYDPNTNAMAAFSLSGGGANFTPWSVFKRNDHQQYMDDAQAAMTSTGLGDAVFNPGMTPGGRAANVNINVTINSTGDVRYDAKALGEAVRPVLSNVMAEISTKRGS